jgi:hypothetical protein
MVVEMKVEAPINNNRIDVFQDLKDGNYEKVHRNLLIFRDETLKQLSSIDYIENNFNIVEMLKFGQEVIQNLLASAMHKNDDEVVNIVFPFYDINFKNRYNKSKSILNRAFENKYDVKYISMILKSKDIDITITNSNYENILHIISRNKYHHVYRLFYDIYNMFPKQFDKMVLEEDFKGSTPLDNFILHNRDIPFFKESVILLMDCDRNEFINKKVKK